MASTKQRIFWDSCVWICLVNKEPGYANCEYCINCAKAGDLQIWSSSLVLAEVLKKKVGRGQFLQLAEIKDIEFEKFIQQDYVTEVQIDHDIAVKARQLCRKHSTLRVNDAVHFATALLYNADALYTGDPALLGLSTLEATNDGRLLTICEPPAPPPLVVQQSLINP